MDALDSPATPFGLGKSFAYETAEILPRLLWKDKPEFLSTQIFIRQEIGLHIVDSSPHPMLQFYYELGWPGIALGFFLMGRMMKCIVARMHSMLFFFFFAFVWSAMIQVEVGVYLNLLIVVRAAIIVYVMWRIVRSFIRVGARRPVWSLSAFHRHRDRIPAA